VIEVDGRFYEDDIDDQIPVDNMDVDTPQFYFVSNILTMYWIYARKRSILLYRG
jgi:hypothetical protein